MEVFHWNCNLLRLLEIASRGVIANRLNPNNPRVQSMGNYPSTCNLIRFLQLKNIFLV